MSKLKFNVQLWNYEKKKEKPTAHFVVERKKLFSTYTQHEVMKNCGISEKNSCMQIFGKHLVKQNRQEFYFCRIIKRKKWMINFWVDTTLCI